MYHENVVDRCARHLKENHQNEGEFLRITRAHEEIVVAAVEYLEKLQCEALYERNRDLKISFSFLSTNSDDDSEEDDEDFARGLQDESPLQNNASSIKGRKDDNVNHGKENDGAEKQDEELEDSLELYSKARVSTELSENGTSNVDLSDWLTRLQLSSKHDKPYKVCDVKDAERLSKLRCQFPNLATVVEQIIGAATLSAKAKAPFELPALLIDGPPGIGKSYLIQELSELLNIPLIKINMANLSGRFELVGGHRTYRNSEPSILFKELYECTIANPFVLFDEAECGDSHLYQPLYHMVEGSSFRDHFLNIDFRVDGGNYFFITNDKELLAPALRSRLIEFVVGTPTKDQMFQILQRLYDEVCESSDLFDSFYGNLNGEHLVELSLSSLRVAKNRIKSALLTSAAKGSTDCMLLSELIKTRTASTSEAMGFIK